MWWAVWPVGPLLKNIVNISPICRYSKPSHRARLRSRSNSPWQLSSHCPDQHLWTPPRRQCHPRFCRLQLGCALCETQQCPCSATVDFLSQYALTCKKNPGRIQRHAWLNDLIHRALIRAETPAVKEPPGLCRNDGKRPDGMTLVPWQSGHSATWTWPSSTHWQHPMSHRARSRPIVQQQPRQTERLPSTLVCLPVTCFSGGCGHSWDNGGKGTQIRAGD